MSNPINNTYGLFVSAAEFWVQNTFFNIGLCLTAALFNGGLFFLITMDRKTRWELTFYILISLFSIVKIFTAVVSMGFGVYQIFGYFYPVIVILKRIPCICVLFPLAVGEYFISIIMLAISIDRYMAVMYPNTYAMLMKPKLTMIICSFLLLLTICIMLFCIAEELKMGNDVLLCINPFTYMLTLQSTLMNVSQVIIGLMSVLTYAVITVSLLNEFLT